MMLMESSLRDSQRQHRALLVPSKETNMSNSHIGEIEIAMPQSIAADLNAENRRTRPVVPDSADTIVGGGLLLDVASRHGRDRSAGEYRRSLAAQAAKLNSLLTAQHPAERLAGFRRRVAGRVVFTTSFGLEDQVILHMLREQGIDIDVVTLDTGRLFPETYELWAESERCYGLRIRAIHPQHQALESLIGRYGINGFYTSREARSSCCYVRKVEPLNRALDAALGWIVGLRADQSGSRQGTALVAADDRGLLKLSPLFDWAREAVRSYALAHKVPLSPLHDRGFLSIGCAPCTRAIAPGELERAGRWWWEHDEKKECGLHGGKFDEPATSTAA
jgi:phosphoadenosine phosphosulfate reductase